MIEAGVSAAIALLTALVAVHGRLNGKITEVDQRIDRVELKIAERYVQKEELASALRKMEDHMIRIEQKLDQIVFHNSPK
jgi:septal ring factor EnvC (AmiA/AmiB activator)